VDLLVAEERKLEDAYIEGEVAVSLRNADLDAGVTDFRGVLLKKTRGKTDAPLFQRFFAGRTASDVIRMSLRPELDLVSPWVASLKAETDPELKDQGTALEKLVTAGRAAISQYDAAAQALRDFRSGSRRKLFGDANTTRQTVYAELTKLGRTPDWVLSFFRPGRKRADGPAVLTLLDAQAAVAAAQAALREAEAQLAEAQERENKEAAEAAAREAVRKELAEAERQAAEAQRKVAELRQRVST